MHWLLLDSKRTDINMVLSDHSIVFMGSPEFAVPTLLALSRSYNVVGVITQPDRPSGRGRLLSPPPVKLAAHENNLPVIQPRRLRESEAMEQLRKWAPDLIVVAAFGQILRQEVLDLPQRGCINVHASMLPRWRGAAPIQAAILHGDDQTGVTIMCMEAGIDTGPILSQLSTPIDPGVTAGELDRRLAVLGAELLVDTIPGYLNGEITPKPQQESLATYAPMLRKEDGVLDFSQPAEYLERMVRAFQPWPGAYTFWQGQLLKVLQASVVQDTQVEGPLEPGEKVIHRDKPAVATSQGLLILDRLQPAGKKAMDGAAFLQGGRNWA
jgi:methionyl-tRNA formyltransferase